jgi:hypothetical protein
MAGDGVWVVLGAAIGTFGSIATSWLNAHLQRSSQYPKYDKAIDNLLKAMLEAGPKWRNVRTLANVTGLSESDVKEYLVLLGARGSETDSTLWGLISRNPLKDIDASGGS